MRHELIASRLTRHNFHRGAGVLRFAREREGDAQAGTLRKVMAHADSQPTAADVLDEAVVGH
jgi:hypothetical protein